MKGKSCSVCQGFGWYPIGMITPIGEGDAHQWRGHVLKCPICGAGDVDMPQAMQEMIKQIARKK